MAVYAIGAPGQPVRQFLDSHQADADAQLGAGEVAIETAAPGRLRIAEDGGSLGPDMPATAELVEQVRVERYARLRASDEMVVTDRPLPSEQRAAWEAYRQALRDLPQEQPNATPDTVIWPDMPA